MFNYICVKDDLIYCIHQRLVFMFMPFLFFFVFPLCFVFMALFPLTVFNEDDCVSRWITFYNITESIKPNIQEIVKNYSSDKKVIYWIRYVVTLILNLTSLVMFWYLSRFEFIYIKRVLPCILHILICSICVYVDLKTVSSDKFLHDFSYFHYDSQGGASLAFNNNNLVRELQQFMRKRFFKRIIFFVIFACFGVFNVIYYGYEIYSIRQYDIILKYKMIPKESTTDGKPLFLDAKLWINSKSFSKSDLIVSDSYKLNSTNSYAEKDVKIKIPSEIALIIANDFNSEELKNASFYVRKSNKKSLICEFEDKSVMYFNIELW